MIPVRRRLQAIILVTAAAAAAAGFAVWRLPAVQDLALSHASPGSLAARVSADPGNWRAQDRYGRRLAEAGNLEQAETALRSCLSQRPNNLAAITELGKGASGRAR